MKIYKKLVLDSKFEVLEEESFSYYGPIAKLSGGGGSSSTEYPEYIEEHHKHWIRGELTSGGVTWQEFDYPFEELLEAALGADTPYTAPGAPYMRPQVYRAYQPGDYIIAGQGEEQVSIQKEIGEYDAKVDTLFDGAYDWANLFDTVKEEIADQTSFPDPDVLDTLSTAMADALTAAAAAIASAPITTLIAEYEAEAKARFKKEVSQWTAGMADVNAVQTSSFIIGLSLQQREFSKSLDKYAAELKLKVFESVVVPAIQGHMRAVVTQQGIKDNYVTIATREVIALLQVKLEHYGNVAQLQAEINKIAIVAKKEENDFNLMMDVNEAKWDFDLFQYAGNFLAAPAGGVLNPHGGELSTMQSVLGGAATGASIGAAGGVPGAIIGAGAGALAGWIGN